MVVIFSERGGKWKNVVVLNYYLRQQKMQKMIYPVGILITASVLSDDSVKEDAVKHAIPEFLKYNIVESEVRNVI